MTISPALGVSPFGRLSTELRLMIWEYAMQKDSGVRFNHNATSGEDAAKTGVSSEDVSSSRSTSGTLELTVYTPDDMFLAEKNPPILSLVQTCSQIRYEAMPVFLESNSFHISCPIFDNSKGHGEISQEATQFHRSGFRDWLQTLDSTDESWTSRIKDLTIDLGVWRICGCKSSSRSFVDALIGFSAEFPVQRGRTLKVQFQVQWRAICPCCESDTNDESVWPLAFELERGTNDKFFESVLEVCEGRASWILGREGLCGRTRMAWLVQLERASGRLVEVFGWLGRCGREWKGIEESVDDMSLVGEVLEVEEV